MKFRDTAYLLHGKGGSPLGTVAKIEEALRAHSALRFVRHWLPHTDPDNLAEHSVEYLQQLQLRTDALLIGVSIGGLVAARLQELSRPDLNVIAISSPTWADGVRLQHCHPARMALFSSSDPVIKGRTADWPRLALAYDLPWLTHDTDRHIPALLQVILAYVNGRVCRNG